MLNGHSALFRLLVPSLAEIKKIKNAFNELLDLEEYLVFY